MPVQAAVAHTRITADLYNANLALCVLTDTARTITAGHTYTASQTFSAGLTAAAPITITSASASAFAVGRQGATNPALVVDASAASSVTGIKITSAAAAAGAGISVVSSETNEALRIDAKGSGTITLGAASTGAITLTRATTVSATLTTSTVTTGGLVTVNAGITVTAGQKIGVGGSPTYSVHIVDGGFTNTVGFGATSNTADDNWFLATGTVAGTAHLIASIINATNNVDIVAGNNNPDTGNAFLRARVEATSTGDPYWSCLTNGAQEWTAGIDNSDSDKFKIGPNINPSTGTASITITTAGAVSLSGTLAVTGAQTLTGLATFNGGATVASGQTLTVTGATITGLTAASVGAGTFPAGAFVFQGALTIGGALAGVTTAAVSDTITSSKSGGRFLHRTGASTDEQYLDVDNTGSRLVVGVESSVGGQILAGSTAYAAIINTFVNVPIQIGINNALIATWSSTGLALNSKAVSGITTLAIGGALSGATTIAASTSITITKSVSGTGLIMTQGANDRWIAYSLINSQVTGNIGIEDSTGGNLSGGAPGGSLVINTSSAKAICLSIANNTTFQVEPGGGFRIVSTSAPSTLADGQIWWDGTDFKGRKGGATVTITTS